MRARVIVTGSRNCTAEQALFVQEKLNLALLPWTNYGVTLVEGHCPYGGVDRIAERWGKATEGVTVESHPADFEREGRSAGPRRNQIMVNRGANLIIAFPSSKSTGTWDCLKKAAAAGIPGRVYPLP